MSAVLKPPRFDSAEAFLAWEALQSERHEYVDGEAYAMTGARLTHNTITLNACVWLRLALKGKPCRVFGMDAKLQLQASSDHLYPDVMVTCDPRDHPADEDRFIRHPWLVVEVLSDRSAAYDRGRKFELYRSIDTLTHYLLVEQDRPHADLFFKNAQGQWVLQPLAPGSSIALPFAATPWPVDSLFDAVDFTVLPAAPGPTELGS